MPDPSAVTAAVVQAVQESDVRAILAKGWSGRLSKDEDTTEIRACASVTAYADRFSERRHLPGGQRASLLCSPAKRPDCSRLALPAVRHRRSPCVIVRARILADFRRRRRGHSRRVAALRPHDTRQALLRRPNVLGLARHQDRSRLPRAESQGRRPDRGAQEGRRGYDDARASPARRRAHSGRRRRRYGDRGAWRRSKCWWLTRRQFIFSFLKTAAEQRGAVVRDTSAD